LAHILASSLPTPQGEHAHRIWDWIYTQDCFDGVHDTPPSCDHEEAVFYRIVSGVHTSISAHVAHEYLLDEEKGVWGPHLGLFRASLGEDKAAHVQNLYFVYLFVLQAAMKAAPRLREVAYHTGIRDEDVVTQARLVLSPPVSEPSGAQADRSSRAWL